MALQAKAVKKLATGSQLQRIFVDRRSMHHRTVVSNVLTENLARVLRKNATIDTPGTTAEHCRLLGLHRVLEIFELLIPMPGPEISVKRTLGIQYQRISITQLLRVFNNFS